METISEKTLFVIIAYGAAQNCVLAVTILSRLSKKRDMKKALSFFLCLAAMTFYIMLPIIENTGSAVLFYVCITATASIGPLYYISIKTIINGDNNFNKTGIFHFIPAGVLLISAVYLSYWAPYFSLSLNNVKLTHITAAIFHAAIYSAASVFFLAEKLPGKISGNDIDFRIKLRLYMNILFCLCFIISGAGYVYSPGIYHISIIIILLLVLSNYIIYLRFPLKIEYYRDKKNKTYFASVIPDKDPESFKNELLEMLVTRGLSREELSLYGFASLLKVHPYQLSHFINNYLETSFTDLINSCRIEDAKNMIIKSPETSIIEIAYEAGFNSKASFNRAFKRFTGFTPTEFRSRKS